MRIIGVYNIKGGVGKTATAVNLAYVSAAAGFRTLVWDLDPQGAATYYFRVKPRVKGGGERILRGQREIDRVIKGTDFERLDLLPADFSYRNMDLVLGETKKPAKQLLRLLHPLAEEFDYIYLDCPPSISLVSENIFRAADALLIPTIPTTLSVRTYQQLLQFLDGHGLAKISRMPLPSGFRPRKYSSRQPGFATGSKVGFGMKRLTFPPTSRQRRPPTSAQSIARFFMRRSMCRVKASSAS